MKRVPRVALVPATASALPLPAWPQAYFQLLATSTWLRAVSVGISTMLSLLGSQSTPLSVPACAAPLADRPKTVLRSASYCW